MVRLTILAVLLFLTVWEWRRGTNKFVYLITLTGLFAFFSLRYGQGTDYLTYLSIYANVQPLSSFPSYAAFQYNKIEIGFFYLMSFFRMLKVHYVVFVACVTLFSLLMINRFLRRFSPLPIFGLTCFFAVYSLVYMESGIRQLISLSIALGWVFPAWQQRRRVSALAGIAVATLMHNSAIVMLLLVFFRRENRMFFIDWKKKTVLLVLAIGAALVVVINFVNLMPVISLLPARLEYTISTYYLENNHLSLTALTNRGLFMLIIFLLALRAKDQLTLREKFLFNLYVVGFCLYVAFMSFDLIASRTNVYFRIVEIALIPALFVRNRDFVRKLRIAFPAMLLLISFLYVKDITAVMDYAEYYNSKPWEYPYITVFNSERLLDEKYVNIKNASAMNAYETGGLSWDEYYNSLLRKPTNRSRIVTY